MGNVFGRGGGTGGTPAEQRREHYQNRLTRFYEYWNPAKLVNPQHVAELLDKYVGREEELLSTLIQKYGKEPPEEAAEQDRGGPADSSSVPRKNSEEIHNALHAALWDKNDEFTGRRRRSTAHAAADGSPAPASATSHAAAAAGGGAHAGAAAASGDVADAGAGGGLAGDPEGGAAPALPQASDAALGDAAGGASGGGGGDGGRAAAAQQQQEEEGEEEAAPSNFLGDTEQDIQERVEFMKKLAQLRLPMPQNEGHFHASRIFVDSLGKSVYDPEQWIDYLKVKGYKL